MNLGAYHRRLRTAFAILILLGSGAAGPLHAQSIASPGLRVLAHAAAPLPPVQGPANTESQDPQALALDQLVSDVQAANPSLQAMIAAWQAAAARYPQVVSLNDPVFMFMLAPGDLGGHEGPDGYVLELRQAVPWCGKRELRGQMALAEASAARHEVGNLRFELREATQTAFFNYYLAERLAEVNQSTITLIQNFTEIAKRRYEAGQASQQDILQATVELGTRQGRQSELGRDRLVAVARINTLLHRAANCPLPPSPKKLPLREPPTSVEPLHNWALQCRPDLAAQAARIQAQASNLALACKEYYPDLELLGRYDATMEEERMRPMVGMALNVPLQQQRRHAAVHEAGARLQQERADYQNRVDQVRYAVQTAYDRLVQGRQLVRLYDEQILPAANKSLESAVANYTTGQLDFLRLLDAERQLNTQRELSHQVVAEYHARWAELERAAGLWEPLSEGKDTQPAKPTSAR